MSGLAAGKAALLNIAKAFKVETPCESTTNIFVLGLRADGLADIHVATVIVNGFVDTEGWPNHTSPIVAKEYWELYTQKEGEWVYEVIH